MSGICGVVSLDGSAVEEAVAATMAQAAPHRGSAGMLVSRPATAVVVQQSRRHAHSRVERAGILVVADARIDNAEEIRAALGRRGRRTAPPTTAAALIAAAYEAWGASCAERIIGDFAFLIWDSERKRALAARDPMGLRSVFYRVEAGRRLLVATEVKQILAAPGVPRRVSEAAVAADLLAHFGRPDWSFYEGVDQLPPGHLLDVGTDGPQVRRFWDVDGHERMECGPQEAAEALRRVFTDAVAARLDDDRPAAILLSGGVDSGSVASTAGWLLQRSAVPAPTLHALSWAFDDLVECDERHISRHIVEAYELPATDIPADDAGPLACYPEHLPDADDPFLGAFQPLIEHSLAAARDRGVATVLGGDRGDLLIGDTGLSYLRMLQAGQGAQLRTEIAEHRRSLDDSVMTIGQRHFAAAVRGRLARRTPREWVGWAVQRGRGVLGGRNAGPPPAASPAWVRAEVLARTGVDELAAAVPRTPEGLGFARAERYRAIFTPLHVRGVAWSERTYARYGLGFADPFSDRRMVQLCVALPQSVINRPGDQSKPLMRAAMLGVMPEPARRQADKIVPGPLYRRGLRDRNDLIAQLLADPMVAQRGWVDAARLREHHAQWLAGTPLLPEFWWTLQIELWLRAHWSDGA